LSKPADDTAVSTNPAPRSLRHGLLRTVVIRVTRTLLLVAVLGSIVVAIWMKTTDDGQRAARDLSARWQDYRHGGEAREAAEKLIAMKVRMGTLPPAGPYITLDSTDLQLGDDGFRLIGKCIQLQNLQLIRTDANDERMKRLSGLSRLTSLTIIDCPKVADAGIQCVKSMPELVALCLIGTGIGDDSLRTIGELSELTSLDVSRTRVTDAGMPLLTGLKKLQWLVLIDTAITDDGVAKLDGLTGLRQISLQGSKVTDKGRKLLRAMYPHLAIE
jgi:hypothetical protein